MEWGNVLGGVISGGLSLIGGQLNAAQQRQSQRHADDFQREMARTGIQMRVDDAKKAGIHPLFALGANPPAGQPVMLGGDAGGGSGLADMGQNINEAFARMRSPQDRMKAAAEMNMISAQTSKDLAQAELYKAEAAKLRTPAAVGIPGIGPQYEGGAMPEGQMPNVPGIGRGIIDVQPAPQVSQKHNLQGKPVPGTQAGVDMGYQEIELPNGMPMMIPRMQGSSMEEMFSEMSIARMNALMNYNRNVYGDEWKDDYMWHHYWGDASSKSGKYKFRRSQPGILTEKRSIRERNESFRQGK